MAAAILELKLARSFVLHFNLVCICLLLPFSFTPVSSFSIVKSLPGFSGPLPFKLETGYVGVGDVEFFYYFIESEGKPAEDPLLLWLTGGPGCSAISGLLFEIGPIQFNMVKYNGTLPTLALNPHSWTKVASIIFLDAPVGTGFSYSRSEQGYKSKDTIYAKQSYDFLRKWLLSHQKFVTNPLYIAGDSFSGMIVPIIAKAISDGIEDGHRPQLNLKGYLLGNPATESKFDDNSKIPFAHRLGLISDELYESAKTSCQGDYIKVEKSDKKCAEDLQAISERTTRVNRPHVLEPKCPSEFQQLNKIKMNNRRYFLEDYEEPFLLPDYQFGCRNYNSYLCNIWANDISVQKAIHIRKGTVTTWIRCNRSLPYEKDVQSALSYHLYLNTRGYRALIYSGDHDMLVPYLGTMSWIKALNFSIVDDWRPWMVDGQVAGYSREFKNNFTFATLKGGGHTAPEYQPRECFAMFKRWISGESLSSIATSSTCATVA
ncbi:hypothetical protein SLA2020_471060 [Shorea laevis]